MIAPCPYKIEVVYSDNGTEYKGSAGHEFAKVCPKTNGKAERVIRTLMEMWHEKTEFTDIAHRKRELPRFINYYNTVKPHSALTKQSPDGKKQVFTPYEWLEDYFFDNV